MKKKGIAARLPVKFKSIQSSIFCAVSILVLSAVLAVTVVSLRYTNSSIYENSVMYTQTIIGQLNQNIDSYISYMDNIASLVAGSGDAYKYLYSESGIDALSLKEYNQCRQRLTEQFKTILKGRSDIRNIGIVRRENESSSLFNNGMSTRNQNLKLDTQHWYADAVGKYDHYNLTSSHVQNVISGERPWVITLSRGIRNYTGEGDSDGVVFIDLNYSAISELCTQNSVGTKGYVFILDQDGNIVYHPQQQQLYNELQTENISLIMNAKTDVVTAGKGDDEKISEALAMKNYLLEKGMDSDRVIMEDKSTSTYENIQNSLKILDELGMSHDMTIVTDGFHQYRASLIAKAQGVENVTAYSAYTEPRYLFTYWVREWLGLTHFFMLGS